jgi:hypothetical protein
VRTWLKPDPKQWGDRELFWILLALVALFVWGSQVLAADVMAL